MTTNSPNPVDGEALTLLLKRITTEYLEWSENIETIEDANTCINSCKYIRFSESKKDISGEWFTCCREIKSDSTGICYAVACFVQEYMKINFRLDIEVFFIWRAFDADYAEDEDDTLHAGVYFNGRYYDTYNPEGVDKIEDLKFHQLNSCNGRLFTRQEDDWVAFGRRAFNSNKEYKFMRYLKDKLNPVDGDVQALISDCEREIMSIKQELSRYSQLPHAVQETISLLNSKLKRQQLALAALTAEPVAYWHHSGQVVTREESHDNKVFEICCKVERPLYTTPPAQLLRPVELPQAFAYTIEGMEEYIGGWWLRKGDVIEMLRQQGYEVKND